MNNEIENISTLSGEPTPVPVQPAPRPNPAPAPTNTNPLRYTQITGAFCDQRTVRILRRLLAGRWGELSAVTTYIFQHIISCGDDNLANALRLIALDEMRHMELLGSAIVSFGGIPRFSSEGSFWSARNTNYQTAPAIFIADNIRAEQRAIRNYEDAIQRVSNPSLRALLGEIVEDERRHIQIFEGLN